VTTMPTVPTTVRSRPRPAVHGGAPRRARAASRAAWRAAWRARAAAVVTGGAVALSGCSLPTTEAPGTATDPTEAPVASETPDPARDALIAEIDRLRASVAAARDAFAGAVDAGGTAESRRAAESSLALLVAPADLAPDDLGDEEVRPLFPAASGDRTSPEDAADQLTATLTAARDAGGSLGNQVVDLLRDPVAGDLGAWQRDAAGVLASIDATVASATTLEEQEAAVAELPGLGTRAIAWARLTADASSPDDAHAFAERGVAHLDVILVTLDRVEPGS
jgi:hypothetical protein